VSYSQPLPIEQSALLVMDVQDSFRADPVRWSRRGNPHFEANVDRLIRAYRAASLPVIFIHHTDEDPYFEPTSPHLKLMDFIQRQPDEPLILKDTRNGFTSTNLGELLAQRGARRIAITGIQTEQCCETTARVGADLGYEVDFVTEATQTFPIRHTDPAIDDELTVDEIVRRTEFVLRRRFARITTVEALERELAGVTVPSSR
jgi:nicotinamidase-related amidase